MKKIKISLMTLLSLGIIIFAISCSKNEKSENLKLDTPQSGIRSLSDEELVVKIKEFTQLANNVREGRILKAEPEKMTIDEAKYYISSTLNYTYCNYNAPRADVKVVKTEVIVPIIAAEEKVFIVDAAQGYNNAVDNIREQYRLTSESNKKLVLCSLDDAIIEPENDRVIFKITALIAYGVNPNYPTPQFGVTYQFWWTRNSQNCYDGTTDLGGAPNVIENYVKEQIMDAPPVDCRYYFPDPSSQTFHPLNYEVDPIHDGICDYEIFYWRGLNQNLTPQVKCIGIEVGVHEMIFYQNHLVSLVANFLTQNAPYKMSDLYIAAQPEYISSNETAIFHFPTLYYGTRRIDCSSPSYPIPID